MAAIDGHEFQETVLNEGSFVRVTFPFGAEAKKIGIG